MNIDKELDKLGRLSVFFSIVPAALSFLALAITLIVASDWLKSHQDEFWKMEFLPIWAVCVSLAIYFAIRRERLLNKHINEVVNSHRG
ncbi:MAG: hypothetical protein ABSF56_03035 [Minisyncoccia bacterium]|jgi:hypothetical protein